MIYLITNRSNPTERRLKDREFKFQTIKEVKPDEVDNHSSFTANVRSHIETLKVFLHSKEDNCIVLENNCFIHEDLDIFVQQIDKEIPYLLLSGHVDKNQLVRKENNLYWLHDANNRLLTSSSQGYYITRKTAEEYVYRFDRPVWCWPPKYQNTSFGNIINNEVNGLMCYPPLVISDNIEVNKDYFSLSYLTSSEKTITYYTYGQHFRLLNEMKMATHLLEMAMQNIDQTTSDYIKYFALWDELGSAAYYADKSKGILAFEKILSYGDKDIVKEAMKEHGKRIFENAKYYDEDIAKKLEAYYHSLTKS